MIGLQIVYLKNHSSGQAWIPGTVVEKTGTLSYKSITPEGKSIRCHIDQMRTRVPFSSSPTPTTIDVSSSPHLEEVRSSPSKPEEIAISSPIPTADGIPEDIPSRPVRPRRQIVRPKRFEDFVT